MTMTIQPLSLRLTAAAALALLPAVMPTLAMAGDPAAGADLWRQCRSCHMVVSPTGDTLERGGRVGPNLYGIAGRQAGSVDGFRYSAPLMAAGQAGLVWTEANFVAYVADPTGFIRQATGDNSARSPMNFQLTSGAADLFAYLQSLSN
jgi:cytochrome c